MPAPKPKRRSGPSSSKQPYCNVYTVLLMLVLVYFSIMHSMYNQIESRDLQQLRLRKKDINSGYSVERQHNLESILLEGLPPAVTSITSIPSVNETEIPLHELFPIESTDIIDGSFKKQTIMDGHVILLAGGGEGWSDAVLHLIAQEISLLEYLGEIFTPGPFPSRNLPPHPSSVKLFPANSQVQDTIIQHIQRSLSPHRLKEGGRAIIGVQLGHAWSNGVTVSWLLRQLMRHGECSHLLMVASNPIRSLVAVAELADNPSFTSLSLSSLSSFSLSDHCSSQLLKHSLSATHVTTLAAEQYSGFLDAASVIKSSTKSGLLTRGFFFEADFLHHPSAVMNKIRALLDLPMVDSTEPLSVTHNRCPLSTLLLNYEQLFCSLCKWDAALPLSLSLSLSMVQVVRC